MLAVAAEGKSVSLPLSTRFAHWRRKALRSHLGLLVLGAIAVGLPIALRARFTMPQEPPPWERAP
jgi:hypothetical protein